MCKRFSDGFLPEMGRRKAADMSKKEIEKVREITRRESTDGVVIYDVDFNIQNTFNYVEKAQLRKSVKKEAKLILDMPNFEVFDAYNISAIIDNGVGDISVVFDEDFSSGDYDVQFAGDETKAPEIVKKEKSYMRIRFDEENLKVLQIECKEIGAG